MTDDAELVKAGVEGMTAGIMRPFSDLVAKIAGPAAEEIGLTLQESIKFVRVKRQIRFLGQVEVMMKRAKLEPRRVPLKLLMPIVENASVEEDDELQDKWAALLANSSGNGVSNSAFPEILKQLSHADVLLLHVALQHVLRPYGWDFEASNLDSAISEWIAFLDHQRQETEANISLENLMRLGVIDKPYTFHDGVPITYNHKGFSITELGYRFAIACEEPAEIEKLSESEGLS